MVVVFMSRLHQKIKNGEISLGAWITISHPEIVDILSNMSFDWFVFDLEHAPLTIHDLEIMLMALKGSDITPLVRVPWNDPVYIKQVLDLGVEGVIIPWVNTVDDVRNALRYVRYPPQGMRGVGPRRCVKYGFYDLKRYYEEWNREAIVIVQIETREAVENIRSIVEIEGLTGVFVGPNDLSASLGVFRDFRNPVFIDALKSIVENSKYKLKIIGIMTYTPEDAIEKIEMGFNFIALASDYRYLIEGAKTFLQKVNRKIA